MSRRSHLTVAPQSLGNDTASTVPQGPDLPPGFKRVEVPCESLDQCLADWRLERVDMLKIDVDGFETKIIEGAEKSLRRQLIKNILIEFNDQWLAASGSSSHRLDGKLKDAGYIDVSRTDKVASFFLGNTEDRLYRSTL